MRCFRACFAADATLKISRPFVTPTRRQVWRTKLTDALCFGTAAAGLRVLLQPFENLRIQRQASVVYDRAPAPRLWPVWRFNFRGVGWTVARYTTALIVLRLAKDAVFPTVLYFVPGFRREEPHFIATGIAGLVSHYVVYPMDVLR